MPLGGAALLEEVREQWRADYDYVLVDSRTGLSDTSGICTVLLPDEIVVCFTMNEQSIAGCEAVAESIQSQRRGDVGESTVKIWPLPSRIENGEFERLRAAQTRVRQAFDRYVLHLPRSDRAGYWAEAEVPYVPFFAYEEVLAAVVDAAGSRRSLTRSYQLLACRLAEDEGLQIPELTTEGRSEILRRYERQAPQAQSEPVMILSSPVSDSLASNAEDRLRAMLEASNIRTLMWSRRDLGLGLDWAMEIRDRLPSATVLVVLVGSRPSPLQTAEVEAAREAQIPVIAVVLDGAELPAEFEWLRPLRVSAAQLELGAHDPAELLEVVSFAEAQEPRPNRAPTGTDPQRGNWGGRSERAGRRLSANVEQLAENWFEVTLEVKRISGRPLNGEIVFFLHPRIANPQRTVAAELGVASTTFRTESTFTVAATADAGTQLELDLAQVDDAPEAFRIR